MAALARSVTIAVLGAGTMGAGIAQLAAASGHPTLLYDAAEGAAARGRAKIIADLDKLVGRGKMDAEAAAGIAARIGVAERIGEIAPAGLVIEAIVENLDVKRAVMGEVEAIVAPDAILASNTSSISITAIGRDLARPWRLAGMHFFNPAPVMKLVEIVSGVATAADVAATLFDTAQAWGKVAVHAKSTPGFIVNRVARPYYAEALRLLEEQVADAATLDALLVEGGGFRMGPFALMDLIGNDVNYAVTASIYEAYYQEPRFRPSILQRELVSAGRLGRKSGQGFYDYAAGATIPAPRGEAPVDGAAPLAGLTFAGEAVIEGVLVARTDGRTAAMRARTAGRPVVLLDLAREGESGRVGFACSSDVPSIFVERLVATLAAQRRSATRLPDWPGLVVMRTVAMLANEGFEAVMQGVASEDAIDDAMRHGVNYPRGPIGWARAIGLPVVRAVLDAVHDLTGDPRYRASLALRVAAAHQGSGA